MRDFHALCVKTTHELQKQITGTGSFLEWIGSLWEDCIGWQVADERRYKDIDR